MQEYDRKDADFYDYYSLGIPGDVEFYVDEAKKAGSPILEIGCGTGRILIPTAQAGISITGLDRSTSMLDILRRKIDDLDKDAQSRIQIKEGDMRDFAIKEKFKLVTIPYRAFLHLITTEDQKKALKCIREHLADDGLLILNIFDPRLDILTAHFTPLGSSMKKDSEFLHPQTGRRVIVWDTRQYNPENQTLEQYFIFEELDEDGKVIEKSYTPLNLRYFHRFEMQYLLELCGYKIDSLYGDFQRSAFRYGGEQIWIARKT